MVILHDIFLNITFMLLLVFITYSSYASTSSVLPNSFMVTTQERNCTGLDSHTDHSTKCSYLKFKNPCVSQGYIDYLKVFYCLCGSSNFLGFSVFGTWLLVLFYLLSNTASHYFCPSLKCLSDLLGLSPTIAGVTLLALGNGAPDVFASIVSFAAVAPSGASGNVGLSSILGGAFFVSSVVVGFISICIPVQRVTVSIDRASFLRDVGFLMAALAGVFAILVTGSITLWVALGFSSIYLVYIIVIFITQCRIRREELLLPLLAEEETSIHKGEDHEPNTTQSRAPGWVHKLLEVLKLPLNLPRRLTIPVIYEDRWSKSFAVASVILGPLLLSALYNSKRAEHDLNQSMEIYLICAVVGTVLGIIAMETTEKDYPPKKFQFPWLAGGFLMSVTWSYIIAGELVALLVSIGYILGINPSILGVTVLAWGNSIGDFTANVAMAMNGGRNGAQVAISGCYAGPLFNTLVGLGISLVFSAWRVYPSPYVIPKDPATFVVIGFLVGGLSWAMFMLTRRGMKLDRVLGVGLVVIYLSFLCVRISESLGLINLDGLIK